MVGVAFALALKGGPPTLDPTSSSFPLHSNGVDYFLVFLPSLTLSHVGKIHIFLTAISPPTKTVPGTQQSLHKTCRIS